VNRVSQGPVVRRRCAALNEDTVWLEGELKEKTLDGYEDLHDRSDAR